MSKLFLVYGGTGAQGGAVVKALLDHGARVRMLVRDLARNPFAGTVCHYPGPRQMLPARLS